MKNGREEEREKEKKKSKYAQNVPDPRDILKICHC